VKLSAPHSAGLGELAKIRKEGVSRPYLEIIKENTYSVNNQSNIGNLKL
jgi:hypothetical protein